jgi:hypothetical protein
MIYGYEKLKNIVIFSVFQDNNWTVYVISLASILLFDIILNLIISLRDNISFKDSLIDIFLGKKEDWFVKLVFERFNATYAKSGTARIWLKLIVKIPVSFIFTF